MNIGHSIKQRDYFLFKYAKLKELSCLTYKGSLHFRHDKHLDSRTNKIYEKFSITSKTQFLSLRHLFYPLPEEKKSIPINIQDFFTAESLAF